MLSTYETNSGTGEVRKIRCDFPADSEFILSVRAAFPLMYASLRWLMKIVFYLWRENKDFFKRLYPEYPEGYETHFGAMARKAVEVYDRGPSLTQDWLDAMKEDEEEFEDDEVSISV